MATKANFSAKIGWVPEKRIPVPAVPPRNGLSTTIVPGQRQYWATRIRCFPLFAEILPHECSAIVDAARTRTFSRGETIYIEGDHQRQVILLALGSAKMVKCGEDGSAVILRLCGPGELVGTLGIGVQKRYRCTSQALTACSTLVWESEVFESLSCQFPTLRLNVAYILYKLLEDMEDRFRELSTECVSTRLGHQILRLVQQVGTPSNESVEIRMTREELAQLIGTSLHTVSRLLSKWDRLGIVTTRREGFSVNDQGALQDLIAECAEEDAI